MRKRFVVSAVLLVAAGVPALFAQETSTVTDVVSIPVIKYIAAALAVAFFLGAHLSRPLELVTGLANRIAGGDLSQHVDFMGDFSAAFNSMTRQLKESREQLVELNKQLERPPTDEEVAKKSKLPLKQVREVRAAARAVTSLDRPLGDEHDAASYGDLFASDQAPIEEEVHLVEWLERRGMRPLK